MGSREWGLSSIPPHGLLSDRLPNSPLTLEQPEAPQTFSKLIMAPPKAGRVDTLRYDGPGSFPDTHWSNGIAFPNPATFHIAADGGYHRVKESFYKVPPRSSGKQRYGLLAMGQGKGTQFHIYKKDVADGSEATLHCVVDLNKMLMEFSKFGVIIE